MLQISNTNLDKQQPTPSLTQYIHGRLPTSATLGSPVSPGSPGVARIYSWLQLHILKGEKLSYRANGAGGRDGGGAAGEVARRPRVFVGARARARRQRVHGHGSYAAPRCAVLGSSGNYTFIEHNPTRAICLSAFMYRSRVFLCFYSIVGRLHCRDTKLCHQFTRFVGALTQAPVFPPSQLTTHAHSFVLSLHTSTYLPI